MFTRLPDGLISEMIIPFMDFKQLCIFSTVCRSIGALLRDVDVSIDWNASDNVDLGKISSIFHIRHLSAHIEDLSPRTLQAIVHKLQTLNLSAERWPSVLDYSNIRELHLWSMKKMPNFEPGQWPSLTSFTLCTRPYYEKDNYMASTFGRMNMNFLSSCRSLATLQLIGIHSFASGTWLYDCTAEEVLLHSMTELTMPMSPDNRIPLPNIRSLSIVFAPSPFDLSALGTAPFLRSLTLERTTADTSSLTKLSSLVCKTSEWPSIDAMTALQSLHLQDIYGMPVASSPSLETLSIDACHRELFECDFPHLKQLRISHSRGITSIPSYPQLERLILDSNCYLTFESHPSVRYLTISECPYIKRIRCPLLVELMLDGTLITFNTSPESIHSIKRRPVSR